MSLTPLITSIARCSLHDGPGVRTVVYFKGCGLRCRWCHNPETLTSERQIVFVPSKCIGCGGCVAVCPACHAREGDAVVYRREACVACGRCVELCPTGALNAVGEEKTVEEVFFELQKDIHYYKSSGGGVTFSGGECLLHSDFVYALAEKCKAAGIHTTVETALFVPWESIERVLPVTDLFYADLKIADPEKHRAYTGQDNARILENLARLSREARSVTVRIPVIPAVNDTEEEIGHLAAVLSSLGERVERVELLKYNHLAESKYRLIGAEYTVFASDAQSDADMRALCERLSSLSGKCCTF